MVDELDGAARGRLAQLAAMLEARYQRRITYDYAAAEAECERLAAALIRELGADEVRRLRCEAIPRGGLIVLGMLSYQLGLTADQLVPGARPDAPLLLIDDCAFTGARVAESLRRLRAPRVLIAHLCSPPALRRALLAAEPRVSAAVAARDLTPLASSDDSSAEAAWSERWRALLGGRGYWVGRVPPVIFPWSEPDMPFFNRGSERVEQGWHFALPHQNLKVRARLDPRARGARTGAYRAPGGLVHGTFDDALWLCSTASGEVSSLAGVGAGLWSLLASGVAFAEAVAELAAAHGLAAADLDADLAPFLADLLERGLLEEVGGM